MKRWIAVYIALCLCMVSCFAAQALEAGTYDAPIVSLTTKAPIPAIKAAFAKAFGETAQVEVLPDGSAVMTLENRHMSIKVFGKTYEANVVTMDGAQVVGTKQEKFSNPVNGLLSDPVVETKRVPMSYRVPMRLDESGAQVLTITVDFMDEFMGKGDPHPTDVTLTLDTSAFRLQESGTTEILQDTTVPEESAASETAAQTQTETLSAAAQVGTTAETQTTAAADTQSAQTDDAPPLGKGKTAALVIAGLAVCIAILVIAPIRIQKFRRKDKT